MKLLVPTKIEIKPSPGKGMGVFAIDVIEEGEVIEECHLVKLPTKKWEKSTLLDDYRFCYPQGHNWQEYVLPLGYGCIYNHSDNNNAMWRNHPNARAFQFYALRKIEVGEEICTNYGDDYKWVNPEGNKKI
jgi:SET domain-containing protein